MLLPQWKDQCPAQYISKDNKQDQHEWHIQTLHLLADVIKVPHLEAQRHRWHLIELGARARARQRSVLTKLLPCDDAFKDCNIFEKLDGPLLNRWLGEHNVTEVHWFTHLYVLTGTIDPVVEGAVLAASTEAPQLRENMFAGRVQPLVTIGDEHCQNVTKIWND